MLMLITGLALFIALHFIPVFTPAWRARMMERIGKMPYRLLFGIATLLSLWILTSGWKVTPPYFLYDLGPAVWQLAHILVWVAFVLMVSAFLPTNIRRIVPNPRMSAIGLWAFAHLLANGEDRALILFGSILLWSLIAIWGAYKRDGGFTFDEKVSRWRDGVVVAVASTAYIMVLYIHEIFIGVSP